MYGYEQNYIKQVHSLRVDNKSQTPYLYNLIPENELKNDQLLVPNKIIEPYTSIELKMPLGGNSVLVLGNANINRLTMRTSLEGMVQLSPTWRDRRTGNTGWFGSYINPLDISIGLGPTALVGLQGDQNNAVIINNNSLMAGRYEPTTGWIVEPRKVEPIHHYHYAQPGSPLSPYRNR